MISKIKNKCKLKKTLHKNAETDIINQYYRGKKTMSKQVEIELNKLCEKFDLKLIYLCYQTRLHELLVSTDDYYRLFSFDSDDFEFTLDGSLRQMRLSNKRTGTGKFIVGSFGQVVGNQMIYGIEIAGSIEDLKNNVNIGSPIITDFLTKIENNERTEELLDFAKSKKILHST